ncbi:hypothetical protein LCGC14_2134820 [marine sediment metagenome]|uniref:Uncharacterized protein n=1 Tax=marine sediment metagenome TaxID=412755 RepID=A0A0F9E0A6_9ZZZZ
MKLSVLERLVLLNILPAQGTITTIRIVSDLRAALSFSEAEHKKLKFSTAEDGNTRWESDNIKDKDIAIGPKAHVLIQESLQKMSDEENMSVDLLSVWEKFMDEEKDD